MNSTKKLVFTALCIAIGIVLPQVLHTVHNAGTIFLPMHLPVLFCGLCCGPLYGAICGGLCCTFSHFLTGMPPAPVFPGMLCELIVYGLVSGIMSNVLKNRNIGAIYIELLVAMVAGRIVSGILNALIFRAGAYSMQIWLAGSFVTALPGIAIQLVLLPVLVNRFKTYLS
ncbi:MAG: ECF transporter S component [Erysipelotrichaceae bacterium]|nr:ECF transporter S component [Erysipelotrichaceae bacterium]